MYVSTCSCNGTTSNGEFKRQRRLSQRKRHIEVELCVNLSFFRLFHVGHVVQNRRSEVHFRLLRTNGFLAKTKNERFAMSSEHQI